MSTHAPLSSSVDVPSPPWDLCGAAVVMLQRVPLSQGVIAVLALVRYDKSPVGAYNERAIAVMTRRGPSVVEMQVSSLASLRGGRGGWGYPKTLGDLKWRLENRVTVFDSRFEKRHNVYRARAFGPSLPIRVRAWSAQTLNKKSIRAPFVLRGRARFAWVNRRLGVVVESFAMRVSPPLEA